MPVSAERLEVWEAIFGAKGTASQLVSGAGLPAGSSSLAVSETQWPTFSSESIETVSSGGA